MKQKRERIVALDLIRGFFLIAIIVDHVAWSPSLLFLLTGGGALFASPAEGFFVISGILVGYLYGPKILSHTSLVRRKIWKRAGLLYVLAVVSTLVFTAWARLLPTSQVPMALYAGDLGSFLFNTFTMRYAYGWTDFLPRYAVFMLAAPVLLWLLAKRKSGLVALASGLVWFFGRTNPYLMPFASWQLLFVMGLIIGFYLPQIEAAYKQRSHAVRKRIARPLIGLASVTFAASVAIFLVVPYVTGVQVIVPESVRAMFDKHTLGIGRLLLGTLWFSALYMVVRGNEKAITRATRGVLQKFGESSLLTYCLHGVVLFVFVSIPGTINNSNLIVNTLMTVAIVAMIYSMVNANSWIQRHPYRAVIVRYHATMTQ